MAANDVMCPYCGEMISEKATVCRYCGRILTQSAEYRADGTGDWYGAAPDMHTGEEANRLRRKSRRSFWAIVLLGLVLIFGSLAIVGLLFRSFVAEHNGEMDEWIQELIESDSGDIQLPGIITPDTYEEIAGAYMDAFAANDRDAAFALFPEAARAEYEGDPDGLLRELDENLDKYGTNVDEWVVTGMADMDDDEIEALEEVLPIDIQDGKYLELTVIPDEVSGDNEPFSVYLMLIRTDGEWTLCYAY